MLILIGRALFMLDRLLKQHGEEFVKEGGFSERMTAARVEEKRDQRRAVDEDAPPCPLCGGVMRVRHGKTGDFWGCTNYPRCRMSCDDRNGSPDLDGAMKKTYSSRSAGKSSRTENPKSSANAKNSSKS